MNHSFYENLTKTFTGSHGQNNMWLEQNFCTMAGEQYLLKLLAFYESLTRTCGFFHLWILCMDDRTLQFLQKANLRNVTLLTLDEVEDDTLRAIKPQRKPNEYCWTLKAPLMSYVLTTYQLSSLLYCDSDVYFFSNPSHIFQVLSQYSIYLCPQRDIQSVEDQYGKYQAGIIGFRNDPEGIGCLKYWRAKCVEWCAGYPDPCNDRFGDQKYLDKVPLMYQSVYCETHLGVDAAPWNCVYHNKDDFRIKENRPYLKEDRIIAFHFATLQVYNEAEYDLWSLGKLEVPTIIIHHLFIPYIEVLQKIAREIKRLDPSYVQSIFCQQDVSQAQTYYAHTDLKRKYMAYDDFYALCSIVSSDYLTRALALYSSLKQYQNCFHIWFCATDEVAYQTLSMLGLDNATILNLAEIQDQEVINIRQDRSPKEVCWTLKSWLINYLFKQSKLDKVIYCDCDLYFFAPIQQIYQEWGTYSFFMCTQRADYQIEKNCGYYQAGFIGIKNDSYGTKILNWWKDRCFEWCYDTYDTQNDRWGDQKYLEKIPHLFENIKIITNPGINAGPWNLLLNNIGYDLSVHDYKVWINSNILCLYHFGSIAIHPNGTFDVWTNGTVQPDQKAMDYIYNPYFSVLRNNQAILDRFYAYAKQIAGTPKPNH